MSKNIVLLIVVLLLINLTSSSFSQIMTPVFKAGESSYQCFRIPSIISTNKGTLLAFAEGRKNNCGDAGDIDLVLKRSFDNGATWSDLQLVWSDKDNTCGNPAPVVDKRTGKILLLSTWNLGTDHEPAIIDQKSIDTRRIFLLSSLDDGATWTEPKEITSSVKRPEWTWYATGPVNGIQLQQGKHKDRLLIPCDHIEAGTKKYYSHVIYSDNGGDDWKLGGSTPDDKVNECTIAELTKGSLLLNMRNYSAVRARKISMSNDGGLSWTAPVSDTSLIEPVCQASLIAIRNRKKKPVLAFSNPADSKRRINMTIRFSYDLGTTWSKNILVYAGPSAYSNLVYMGDGRLGLLYEAGEKSPYEGIFFSTVNMPIAEE